MEASERFEYASDKWLVLTQKGNKTLVTRKGTKEMKLLSQLSTVSQNAATGGKFSHLLNKVRKDI